MHHETLNVHYELSFVCCFTHTEASPVLPAGHMNQKKSFILLGLADVRLNGCNYNSDFIR